MAGTLVECVPNFSAGRDRETVEAITAAIESVAGASGLDCHMDPDHNRSVITFVATPEAVVEAAVRGVTAAVERIDLARHAGAHPRLGAADVVPFVPFRGTTLEECAGLAHNAGKEIWERLAVPVYFYEAAALSPEHRDLAAVRRRDRRQPDLGGPAPHPSAGATAVGAREFLIAYNVNLASTDLNLARRIARRVRGSSGGFPSVKALGFPLASRNMVQVSMNLVDFERTPVEEVYETIRSEASAAGVAIASCELVGMIPRHAYELAPRFYQRCEGFQDGLILENRLDELRPGFSAGS